MSTPDVNGSVLVVGERSELRDAVVRALDAVAYGCSVVDDAAGYGPDAGSATPDVAVVCLGSSRRVDASDVSAFGALVRGALAPVPVVAVASGVDTGTRLQIAIEGALAVVDVSSESARLTGVVAPLVGIDRDELQNRRRRARTSSLAALARWERTGESPRPGREPTAAGHVRVTRLERSSPQPSYPRHLPAARAGAGTLTPKQRELLRALASGKPVSHVATELGMSRSNIYTSLRRIGRRLGIDGTSELLGLARQGAFGGP